MRTIVSLFAALACVTASLAAQAETVAAEPVKAEAPPVRANPDNSTEVAEPAAQAKAAEPLKSGLDQPLCVQK